MQRQFFNSFLNNLASMSFSGQKARFPIIDLHYEHTIISRHIISKSIEVSEVINILPQMENVIHNIRGIAI